MWFQDGTRLLLNGRMGPEKKPGTWSCSLVGGAMRKQRDDDDQSVPSPDGSQVAVLRDNTIWIMDLDG